MVIVFLVIVLLLIVLLLVVVGLGRRLVLRGTRGSSTWPAFVLLIFPFPVSRACGGLGIPGWGLAWSAAAVVFGPVVGILWALGIGGRWWWARGTSVRQATALVIPPKFPFIALGGHDEGNEGDKNSNMLEKHG